MIYDFIVVGAGTAGCILARRLSDSGKHTVLLIEAGGKDSSPWFKLPVGYVKSYYNPAVNWMYYSEPEAELGGRRLYAPRGKVQGGSGTINAMIYVRGQRADFDDWRSAGNTGWGYDDVLPTFKRIESHPLGDTAHHGSQGLIGITQMRRDAHPLCDDFLRGCAEQGFALNDDFNGATLEGAGVYEANIRNGRRDSTSFAYLHPVQHRTNLRIERHALAQKLNIDAQRRAVSVEVVQDGVLRTFTARHEIVLSAGAVDSPKLLQLSGIGDPDLLQQHGIAVQRALPAVGKNLQDHLAAWYYLRANKKTLNDELGSWLGQARNAMRYALTRRGPLALSVNQAGGFFRSSPEQQRANLQLYFNPLSYEIPQDTRAKMKPDPYSGFLMGFNACRPTSRGRIDIVSPDARVAARIAPGYLGTEHDRDEAVAGSRLIRQLMKAPALRKVTLEEVKPGASVTNDTDMLRYFRDTAGSIYHLCGSCAMGPDAQTAVVSDRLKVHGIDGLRVVDASVFPNITSGNTQAAVMMVAERGAELLLADASQA